MVKTTTTKSNVKINKLSESIRWRSAVRLSWFDSISAAPTSLLVIIRFVLLVSRLFHDSRKCFREKISFRSDFIWENWIEIFERQPSIERSEIRKSKRLFFERKIFSLQRLDKLGTRSRGKADERWETNKNLPLIFSMSWKLALTKSLIVETISSKISDDRLVSLRESTIDFIRLTDAQILDELSALVLRRTFVSLSTEICLSSFSRSATAVDKAASVFNLLRFPSDKRRSHWYFDTFSLENQHSFSAQKTKFRSDSSR